MGNALVWDVRLLVDGVQRMYRSTDVPARALDDGVVWDLVHG